MITAIVIGDHRARMAGRIRSADERVARDRAAAAKRISITRGGIGAAVHRGGAVSDPATRRTESATRPGRFHIGEAHVHIVGRITALYAVMPAEMPAYVCNRTFRPDRNGLGRTHEND